MSSCQLTATAWMHYCVGVMLALVSSPAQDVVVRFSSPCDSDKFASEAKLQVSCMQVRDQRGPTPTARLDHMARAACHAAVHSVACLKMHPFSPHA